MKRSQIQLISAMLIFGSLGLFVRQLPLPSAVIAALRAGIGAGVLGLYKVIRHTPLQLPKSFQARLALLISGILLGSNWVFLFEAYRRTTVSVATLCYYLAPILVAFFTLMRSRTFNRRSGILLLSALIGLGLLINPGAQLGSDPVIGISFGLIAALMYAGIILINPYFKAVSGLDSSCLQLLIAALILLLYLFIQPPMIHWKAINTIQWGLVLVLGIVHTGIAYALYFSALPKLNSTTAAFLSYIDPISALLFSGYLLHEPFTILQIVGAVLILGVSWKLGRP